MENLQREAKIRYQNTAAPTCPPGHEEIRFLLRLLDQARAENADLQRTFDLMWEADQRAIKAWQEANPGNEMVWPDRTKLITWLLEKIQ